MKQLTRIILSTTCFTIIGLAQAQESSESTGEPVQDHKPMTEESMMDRSMRKAEDVDCKEEHDHRKFKGLPSAPCDEAPDDEGDAGEDEKVKGHNHREQNK